MNVNKLIKFINMLKSAETKYHLICVACLNYTYTELCLICIKRIYFEN
jgi:hypothetical protein